MTDLMRFCLPLFILLTLFSCTKRGPGDIICTASLLDEMTDLKRLTRLPDHNYRTVQYSSYDRRSVSLNDTCWFSNDDGFGNEPIPGFEKILKEPGSDGIGEYLICDIKKPGAILRLWTAGISGEIRLYLDNTRAPFYKGSAQDFFWKTPEMLSGSKNGANFNEAFRQFDATYFPVPFSHRCRIEWTGDIKKIHFYHVELRIYDKGARVKTFNPADFELYKDKFLKIKKLADQPENINLSDPADFRSFESNLTDSLKQEIFYERGTGAIEYLAFRLSTGDIENALRRNILNIYFDGSSVPQVQAPLGDFFGSAPGINPYGSLPFGVFPDSTLVCRFVMPFKKSVRIEIENHSGEQLLLKGQLRLNNFPWEDGKTMHFRARWKIDHGLTASDFDSGKSDIQDILYLMASGKGRLVGAAAFIYNPSNATTSWGNWWGEGDEKIFADNDTFPSFYGTGSEDYFNYSWSSPRIFAYSFCGQTRNDGPGNRGYVSDYRWHISDDILFSSKIAFLMELGHHGIVPGFSYGRIVYFYALPGTIDNFRKISVPDIMYLPYNRWDPVAYLGSAGYRYIQAEELIHESSSVRVEKGKIWADDNILMWRPSKKGETIRFNLNNDKKTGTTVLGFTLAHEPEGGIISVFLNGSQVLFDGRNKTDLFEPVQTTLVNHFSEPVKLKEGANDITLISQSNGSAKKIGIDFIWVKEF